MLYSCCGPLDTIFTSEITCPGTVNQAKKALDPQPATGWSGSQDYILWSTWVGTHVPTPHAEARHHKGASMRCAGGKSDLLKCTLDITTEVCDLSRVHYGSLLSLTHSPQAGQSALLPACWPA